jgi:hypothetical protein
MIEFSFDKVLNGLWIYHFIWYEADILLISPSYIGWKAR